ncbi:hypothetical protein V8E54_007037 [Elaphomyces granulatus]
MAELSEVTASQEIYIKKLSRTNGPESASRTEDKDGEESALEFTIPLTTDDFQEGQLGSKIYKNDEQHQNEPRSLVTAEQKEDVYYFDVRIEPLRDIPRWVLFPDENNKLVPATLIILNLCLQRYTSNARFRFLGIHVDVMDADMVHRNAHEGKIDLSHQPQVLDFQPRQFEGLVTELIGQTHWGIPCSASDSFQLGGGGGGGGFSASKRSPAVKEGYFTVHGTQRNDPASGVVLENKVKKDGVPAEVSVGLVVQCTPGRRFATTLKLEADVKVWRTQRAVAGEKDEPLYFLPPTNRSDFKEFPAAKYEKLSKLEHLRVSGGGDRRVVSLGQP